MGAEPRDGHLAVTLAREHQAVDFGRREAGIGQRRVDGREDHGVELAARGSAVLGLADTDNRDLALDRFDPGRARFSHERHACSPNARCPQAATICL